MNNSGLSATAMVLDKIDHSNESKTHQTSKTSLTFNGKKLHTNEPEKQLPTSSYSTESDTKSLSSRICDVSAYQAGSVLYTAGCGFFTADALKQLPRNPKNIAGCVLFSLGSVAFLYDAFKN